MLVAFYSDTALRASHILLTPILGSVPMRSREDPGRWARILKFSTGFPRFGSLFCYNFICLYLLIYCLFNVYVFFVGGGGFLE